MSMAPISVLAGQKILTNSLGETGIDAIKLQSAPYNLTGRKIAIGQVELGRPGYFGMDKTFSKSITHGLVRVFYRDEIAKTNVNVDNHAALVAGIMISNSKGFYGVAPQAKLYSTAVGSPKQTGQAEQCLSSQHIARQNGGDVRAINFSFGESLERDSRDNPILDGNALLTQCIDWSAKFHNVLYVIAGNQGKGGIPIPTDNYNGITVAYSAMRDGIYSKVDFANLSMAPVGVGKKLLNREINASGRRGVSLLAPGQNIKIINQSNQIAKVTGTSFAAPHVTASVALLQEYGDQRLKAIYSQPNIQHHWSPDSRKHEVMKAVLLNSADKIKDTGNGKFLGMKKIILTKNNKTWLESDAYSDRQIPIDYQMGTGQLNVFRAYQQFSAGRWSPDHAVNSMGWDYNVLSVSNYKDYIIDKPLQKDSFISATLVWDRLVELNDKNNNCQYDMGETFLNRGLNNLVIYLMKAEDNDINKSMWSSESKIDNIQHIFHLIPETGRYKIRVYFKEKVNESNQNYALAWWSVSK